MNPILRPTTDTDFAFAFEAKKDAMGAHKMTFTISWYASRADKAIETDVTAAMPHRLPW